MSDQLSGKKKSHWLLWLIFIVIVLPLCISIISMAVNQNSTANQSAVSQSENRQAVPPENWEYSSEVYGIENESFKSATTNSSSPVNFSFPYNKSKNYGHLTIAKRGKQIQAYLTVDTGQFNGSYSGQPIKVKFDQGKTRVFNGVEPSDHQSGWLFITDANGFISVLKKAKIVKMEAEFYREGARLFEFDISGLDLNKIDL